ncbi:hypothetical protein DSLASN_03680 [Desulfoluna limicola]|uniref:HEAT repeat domain-containing protein n=1 Tax=Desulfoluna limicola TaxID=2810562 RepID=A0ABN6EYP9_9BACT|nr:HEAT repeat domain-containing protein [Desulfoluna limicola]BCS94736.1 hypothetical protein DSLASN_03680 [Desulfoluna limicola]
MNGYVKTLLKCAVALGLYHIAATFFVRSSNLFLLAKTRAITEAGYLALPNPATSPSLDSWEAALCGALFFTLTSGALVLFTALCAPSLHRIGFVSRKIALGLHAALLGACFLLIGLSPQTLPLLLGTAGAYLVLLPSGAPVTDVRLKPLLFHTLIPVLLALSISGTHLMLPRGLFSGFRDAFLFDNPAGNAVRHFYYTYTLFPAEAFKRLEQKSQVTVSVTGGITPAVKADLSRLGHIPVPQGPYDYTLSASEHRVTLSRQTTEQTVELKAFNANPATVFHQFSKRTDPFGPLRTLTWYALFTAFPLLFYLLFHTAGTLTVRVFFPLQLAARIATIGVTVSAAFFVLLLAIGLSLPENTQAALAALADARGTSATATEVISRASAHESALVRYRAALAVPRIRHPLLKRDLLTRLLTDKDTNVVCQALGAMGETRDRSYITLIEEAVRTRPEWYVQWYGYRAMRRLGWQQNPM